MLATTGLLYLFYNSWSALGIAETASVAPVALLHTAGAFLLVGFMILHIYMTTTGITVLENIIGLTQLVSPVVRYAYERTKSD